MPPIRSLPSHRVRILVVGLLPLTPPSVQKAAEKAMRLTAHHSGAVLSVCIAYASRFELAAAAAAAAAAADSPPAAADSPPAEDSTLAQAPPGQPAPLAASPPVEDSTLAQAPPGQPAPLAATRLWGSLWTTPCPPVDLLIRTSGERRLSDFQTWQAQAAVLSFSEKLWPEFGVADLVQAVMDFQWATLRRKAGGTGRGR